jgi:hypothetical protein
MLIAIPLIWAARRAQFGPEIGQRDLMVALVLGALPYLTFRGGYVIMYSDFAASDYIRNEQLSRRPILLMLSGAWQGLRMFWISIFALSLCRALPARRILLIVCAFTLGVSLLVAGDFSRSAAILAPVALAGMIKWGIIAPRCTLWLAATAFALNLILPAKHVFAIGSTYLRPLGVIRAEASAFESARRTNPQAQIRVNILDP